MRTLLLLLVATVRGVYTSLEQPGSSLMEYLPDFQATAQLIKQHLGDGLWKSQFLSESQIQENEMQW